MTVVTWSAESGCTRGEVLCDNNRSNTLFVVEKEDATSCESSFFQLAERNYEVCGSRGVLPILSRLL